MSSGMRISECAGILLENVNMDKQTALILGKGAKWRLVPFDDKAALAVSRYVRRESPSRCRQRRVQLPVALRQSRAPQGHRLQPGGPADLPPFCRQEGRWLLRPRIGLAGSAPG